MLRVGLKKISNSPEETITIGREIGKRLSESCPICLKGDLGAGKTTLIKGIAAEITSLSPHEINSPTFTYLNIYEGKKTLYHFDCYRLDGPKDFCARGLDEYFEGLCLIEWGEKIEDILPHNRSQIIIEPLGKSQRVIYYEDYSL